jgi:uncharacterized SAM-binding protein YcdF (DUF218 family)
MEILIQLACLWVLWLVSPRYWRRLLAIIFTTVAIGLISVSSLGVQLGMWGLTVWVPPDTGKPADAIVVLGRGEAFRDLRIAAVQELWQSQRAPQIFASGMMDARAIVHHLAALGIPAQRLSGEECSQSTQENAIFAAAMLRPQSKQQIVLVTDTSHMLRSFLIFRHAGFHVIPHATPLPLQFTSLQQQYSLLREYFALSQYLLSGKLLRPLPTALAGSPTGVTERIRQWKCQVGDVS